MIEDIIPLAYTQVDWKTFIKACQNTLGISPTRGLDSAGIKLDDHQAYLACLGLDNKPIEHMRTGGWSGAFKHVHFSFVSIAPLNRIITLCGNIDVLYHVIDPKYDNCLVIYTGSVEQWQKTILKFAVTSNIDVDLRATVCRIMNHLENMGFKDLWHGYTKRSLNDNTFILIKR